MSILWKPCRCGKHKIWFWRRFIYRIPWLGPWLSRRRSRAFEDRMLQPIVQKIAERIERDVSEHAAQKHR